VKARVIGLLCDGAADEFDCLLVIAGLVGPYPGVAGLQGALAAVSGPGGKGSLPVAGVPPVGVAGPSAGFSGCLLKRWVRHSTGRRFFRCRRGS